LNRFRKDGSFSLGRLEESSHKRGPCWGSWYPTHSPGKSEWMGHGESVALPARSFLAVTRAADQDDRYYVSEL
jgi:hypothetical protein